MSQYIFDNAAPQASQRFDSLERLYDSRTLRCLEATGISDGWHCLEVGGGGGSIARWMSARAGPTGRVLVTDINPQFLTSLVTDTSGNIVVQQHDIGVDPLPEGTFDLIHARLVLIHVPTRQAALYRLVAALKPGGWLVVEDFDAPLIDRAYPIQDGVSATLFRKMLAAQAHLMAKRGFETGWGRKLFRRFQEAGLVEVGMDGFLAVWTGTSPGARLDQANFEQVRAEAVSAGLISDDDVEAVLALLDDPSFEYSSSVMMTAWGRRP